ncbi:MAG TPA: septum formation initiator family protein [Vicinamibacterales bacterium]|nr:septum formation initiator family protein [Vicinamibacterales bacterium]
MQHTPADAEAARVPPVRRQGSRWVRHALVFVSCVLLLDSIFGDRGLVGTIKARADYRRVSDALARLKAENAGLREQARRLHEDPVTIEGVARKDLGLIGPGEILVIVKDVK